MTHLDADPRQLALRRATLLLDCATLALSAGMAFLLHSGLKAGIPGLKAVPEPRDYTAAVYLFVPVWIALDSWLGLNQLFERRTNAVSLFVDLVKLHGLGFLLVSSLLFVTHSVINRAIVILCLGVNLVVMYVLRTGAAALVANRWRQGLTRDSVLLIGEDDVAMRAYLASIAAEEFPPRVVGALTRGTELSGTRVLGSPERIAEVLRAEQVDQVMFFAPFQGPQQAKDLLEPCERAGLRTAFAIGTVGPYVLAPQVVASGGMPFLTYDWVTTRPGALAVKHTFDAVVAFVALVLLAPLLLLIGVLVGITMGRPIIYSQERVGLYGRRFRLFKFRTMVPGADARRGELLAQNELSGPVFKMTDDPRVTALGKVLRRWSLDELPQLLNVLLGQMSLVGPRPLPVIEQQEIQGWYRRRLSMKPGITGIWQVSGRSDVDFDEWMKMDLRYIEDWSLRLDLDLLQRTLPAVLRRRGAR